jgi:hypothetical protein
MKKLWMFFLLTALLFTPALAHAGDGYFFDSEGRQFKVVEPQHNTFEIYSLRAESNKNFWLGVATGALCIWGFSQDSNYGTVTGALFLCKSYGHFLKVRW